ncbi:DUF300-domain-containing protein [Guyanagaster necrorhizus]|uniref:DUF300-domain-containing protein n=1 Tax=Guyanagaster necrorhizus TaxID=856835 RepID=A0A9P8ALB8_9AGAR|nr:DUF300-domain-containing protein [Guyanagaster necrorhizus MCA 3950]KAG7439476.1 DUF300-domain-containing protein [Guyanagaster necrorhizus MCA 3950]
MGCASDNQDAVDQSSFWSPNGVNWDAHRIGWAIAGGCSVLTLIITLVTAMKHAKHYSMPNEQRQILRIIYMPAVYAIISFFSYRFFRSYTYYSLIEVAYEAVTLSAFILLLIEYVAATASAHSAENAIARKDKSKLPIPFCYWRYRPTKPYFMYTVKWSVLQYVIIRPLCSIVGIVCEKYNVLCESEGFDFHYANAYMEIVDFFSISISLYGLLLFYGLTKEELAGRRPLAKFLCIKLIVMLPWYQSFVFSWLEGRVIHATEYWTAANIANGLNALAICIEMVFFSALMLWAYTPAEYTHKPPVAGAGRAILDSINYADFFHEIALSLRFFIDYFTGKPWAHGPRQDKTDFAQAFGLNGARPTPNMPYDNLNSGT